MKRKQGGRPDSLDGLIEQITMDAYGDYERLSAFRQSFEDEIAVPCAAFVVGESVTLTGFGFDGNERRGVTAKCRRSDGAEYFVSAADVVLLPEAQGACYLDASSNGWGLHPQRMQLPSAPDQAPG